MQLLSILLFVLLAGFSGHSAAAQCLPLSSFVALGVEPESAAPPAVTTQLLAATEWKYNGAVGNTKEIFWTSMANGEETPAFRLSLRPVLQRYDVVLKTTQPACVKQLRSELNSRKIKPEPITCPGCEGQRYVLPEGGSVSFYSAMKGAYPLVVVFHPAETPAVGAAKAAATRNP